MTIETVTGTLTVTTDGQAAPPESFSLTLTLGTAAHVHAGYGAVAAGDWTVELMGCSLTDPAGCLADLAGSAAGSIADSRF